MMTYFVIILFSIVVWMSNGSYNTLGLFLVISFIAWVYVRIFKPAGLVSDRSAKAELYIYRIFPWISALMIAVKPNLIYVVGSLSSVYFIFKFIPIGLNLISYKVLPVVFLLFFMAVLFLSPHPHIDVFRSNSLAVAYFLHGFNPYSQTYPDIYRGHYDYHPGFLYWPATLYLQAFSKVIFGDIRAILVIAWWGGAFFLPKTHLHFQALRKLWWFIPFIPFGLEQGWIDPLLSLAAVITLWSMMKKRWYLMAVVIAMAACVKQYGFIVGIFPLAALALDREWKVFAKVGLSSLFIILLVFVPFLIWDFQGFFTMTIVTHAWALPRVDALNFTAFWMRTTGTPFPVFAQLGMTLCGFGCAIFHLIRNRARGRLAVISESWAMAFGFFMLFGKFSFCNYYWLLISFFILSLAFEEDSLKG